MSEAKKYTNRDREQVFNLAEEIKIIQDNKNLTKTQKENKLRVLVKKNNTLSIKMIFMFLHKKLWNKKSWATRLTLIGAVSGLTLAGGGGVGIATMGFGIGFPLFLLTSAGGAFIGVIIDEIQK